MKKTKLWVNNQELLQMIQLALYCESEETIASIRHSDTFATTTKVTI